MLNLYLKKMADVDDMFGDEPIVVQPSLSEVNGDSKIDSGEPTPVVPVAADDNKMETEENVENGQSGGEVIAIDDSSQNGVEAKTADKKNEIEPYVSETNIVQVELLTREPSRSCF